jgi:hypothetical protein
MEKAERQMRYSKDMLKLLEDIVRKLGIKIRYEALKRGGICKVKGEYYLFISKALPLSERIEILLDTLQEMDLEGVYLPPLIRETLTKRSN